MRKPRELVSGALYHVSARANRKEMIMDASADKQLFITVLERAKKRFDFEVENFCILGNHYHLMVRPSPGTSLSSLMQWIMSVFAMAWNRIHGLTGHVWGERFFSRVISTFQGFFRVFQYIDLNPMSAGLVEDSDVWPFSGLAHRRRGDRRIVGIPNSMTLALFPRHEPLLLPSAFRSTGGILFP